MRKLYLLLAWLSLSATAYSQSLVAYYPFNGNANDESGNNIHLTNTGAVLTNDRNGNADKAYSFNGNAKLYCSDNDLLDLTGDFSISFWIKRPGSIVFSFALSKHMAGDDNSGSWGICSYSGTDLTFTGTPYWGYGPPNPTTSIIPIDQWRHIVFTYKKTSSEWKYYMNGTLDGNGTRTFNIQNTAFDFTIGSSQGYGNYLNGSLDDIRIYNRVLLPNEIQQLSDIPMMPDLVAYYPLNGNANDMSGNNRHGNPYNGAALTTDKYDNQNSAYNFDGINDGIYLDNTSAIDFAGTPFALSAWIKYSSISTPSVIVGKNNCNNADGFILVVENNKPAFWISPSPGNWSKITSTTSYNDNKWHHVVGVYTGSQHHLYVDGELKVSANAVHSNPSTAPYMKIGDITNSCGYGMFAGSIDEVKIYGAALSTAQVTALYKQSRGSGKAISLKANDYVDIGSIGAESNITIEAWVKRNNNSALHYFISGYDHNSYGFGVNGSNQLFLITQNNQTALSSSLDNLNDGNWHHVAVTNANGSVNFYFDGLNVGNTSLNLTGLISNNYVIGSKLNFQGTSLDGAMDEVRIWNTGLTQAHILDWMTRKLTPDHPAYNSLIRYYNFDETNIFKTIDSKGANTGALVNNVTAITSGAAIGDAAVNNINNPLVWATLPLSTGENFSALQGAGTAAGLFVYVVKDPPENQTGIGGLGSNDHYFGVKKMEIPSGTTASYSAEYNYTGNPFVSALTEPTLQLFKRIDNSAATWSNSGAILNTTANTLTVTGQNTEYILGSSGFGLPVTLLGFEAKKLNATTAQLTWKTATEQNNKGFEIQRSFDGIYFTGIGFINGAGNSDMLKEYGTTDVPGRTGRIFYRLKQVDFDNQGKLSNIVSVFFDQQDRIKLYPNPAQEQVIIEGISNYNRIQLLDVTGKLLKDFINDKRYQLNINLTGLKSGLYIIRLINGNATQALKLVIEN